MSQTPAISVILPTYNGQRYLAESIESCVQQTFTDWELIVVDDASTDGTPGIISDWAKRDARIRSIRNVANRRLPASLNEGFRQARAPYWTWTSDDNRYFPEALAEMRAFLEKCPDVDGVYCGCETIDENGRPTRTYPIKGPEFLWERNCVGACFLYRREMALATGPYEESLFLAEDYDFWLRAAGRFRLRPLEKTLYQYRYHSRSLTETRKAGSADAASRALFRNLDALYALSERSGTEAALRLAKTAAARGDWKEAGRLFSSALNRSPKLTLRCAARKGLSFLRNKY